MMLCCVGIMVSRIQFISLFVEFVCVVRLGRGSAARSVLRNTLWSRWTSSSAPPLPPSPPPTSADPRSPQMLSNPSSLVLRPLLCVDVCAHNVIIRGDVSCCNSGVSARCLSSLCACVSPWMHECACKHVCQYIYIHVCVSGTGAQGHEGACQVFD